MPKLTYDIGYYGKVSIKDKYDKIQYILSTGGSLTLQYTPIMTTGVWGAYWKNATQKIAYAPNFIALSANSGFQLTKGLLQVIESFAFAERNIARTITIYPNGIAGYQGAGYCISFSLQTSQDALVTGDIGFKSGDVTPTKEGDTSKRFTTSSNTSLSSSTVIDDMVPNYTDVYPYWASGVFLSELDNTAKRDVPKKLTDEKLKVGEVVDWSASYSSQLVLVACCTGLKYGEWKKTTGGKAGISADYCALGTMQAQGSFTMLGMASYLSPDNVQKHNKCSITMATASGEGAVSINYGALIWTGASTDVQTGSSLIQSSFSFNALGNTEEAPMNFTTKT